MFLDLFISECPGDDDFSSNQFKSIVIISRSIWAPLDLFSVSNVFNENFLKSCITKICARCVIFSRPFLSARHEILFLIFDGSRVTLPWRSKATWSLSISRDLILDRDLTPPPRGQEIIFKDESLSTVPSVYYLYV